MATHPEVTGRWATPDRPPELPLRRVLVTGYRHWEHRDAVRDVLAWVWHPYTTLAHGACPTGADSQAHDCWTAWGGNIKTYPADWKRYGRRAGPVRNKLMVNAGATLALVFLHPASTGTRGCLDLLTEARIPTFIIEPATHAPGHEPADDADADHE